MCDAVLGKLGAGEEEGPDSTADAVLGSPSTAKIVLTVEASLDKANVDDSINDTNVLNDVSEIISVVTVKLLEVDELAKLDVGAVSIVKPVAAIGGVNEPEDVMEVKSDVMLGARAICVVNADV